MWNTKTEDRLQIWKQFRCDISKQPFFDALQNTVKLWSFAPIVDRRTDYINLGNFPDPWVLLLQDGHTDISKALGMLYTLYLSTHGTDHHYRLQIIKAGSGLEQYYLVIIDGQYVLNYDFNEIVKIDSLKDYMILHDFSIDDLQLTKL